MGWGRRLRSLRRRALDWVAGHGLRPVAVPVAVLVVVAAVGIGAVVAWPDPPADCRAIDVLTSPEKADLVRNLARRFDEAGVTVDGRCVSARVRSLASGLAVDALTQGEAAPDEGGWDTSVLGERPVVWTPAASSWGGLLDHRRAALGRSPLAGEGLSAMETPLVIAMLEPMARALGWPEDEIDFDDLLRVVLADADDDDWASVGHPEWGDFRLGKTNPTVSTSGLHALVVQAQDAWAAAGLDPGTDGGLGADGLVTPELLERDDLDLRSWALEQNVVHYGDTTLTFLDNWARADDPFRYASAVVVEEKSVIDFNRGNPDADAGDETEDRPTPFERLVAVYPENGTIYSDSPMYTLDAPWVDEWQRSAGDAFVDFVRRPESQELVVAEGFRPAVGGVPITAPIDVRYGVRQQVPVPRLLPQGRAPDPALLDALLDGWKERRRLARVLVVLDASGSMSEPAGADGGPSRLDLAKDAIEASLRFVDDDGQRVGFRPDDQVGLMTFTSDAAGEPDVTLEVPVGPLDETRSDLIAAVRGVPESPADRRAPLLEATEEAYDLLAAGADDDGLDDFITAVVLVSNGERGGAGTGATEAELDEVVAALRTRVGDEGGRPVRMFTIAYGDHPAEAGLARLAEVTAGGHYSSGNPRSLDEVFEQVVSNF